MSVPAVPAQIFKFELDFAGSLHCIPMSVRLKLDEVGVKLSLKQWNRLPAEARHSLLGGSCDTPAATRAYRESLVHLIGAHTESTPEFLPVEPSPLWAQNTVPARLVEYSEARGVRPPSASQWLALTPVQRFALYKLTRPGHSNDNFLPAMSEFGLLAD